MLFKSRSEETKSEFGSRKSVYVGILVADLSNIQIIHVSQEQVKRKKKLSCSIGDCRLED